MPIIVRARSYWPTMIDSRAPTSIGMERELSLVPTMTSQAQTPTIAISIGLGEDLLKTTLHRGPDPLKAFSAQFSQPATNSNASDRTVSSMRTMSSLLLRPSGYAPRRNAGRNSVIEEEGLRSLHKCFVIMFFLLRHSRRCYRHRVSNRQNFHT